MRNWLVVSLIGSCVLLLGAGAGAAGPPPGYRMVFEDEFNSDTVSLDRWRDNPFGLDHFNDELEHYTSISSGSNVSQRDGTIVLQAKKDTLGLSPGEKVLALAASGKPIFGGPYRRSRSPRIRITRSRS